MSTISTSTPGLHPLRNAGPGPARMTPLARPGSAADARTNAVPDRPPAGSGPAPGTAGTPDVRPLPGALRVRDLNAPAGPATMRSLSRDGATPRMGAPNAANDAVTRPGTPVSPQASAFASSSFGRGLAAQRSFAEALGAARLAEGFDAREGRPEAAKAREAAEQLVATTLVLPVLKQLRESNNAAPPFAPTNAEKQFGALLDHRLAHDIVKGANFPMVDRLARDLLRSHGTAP